MFARFAFCFLFGIHSITMNSGITTGIIFFVPVITAVNRTNDLLVTTGANLKKARPAGRYAWHESISALFSCNGTKQTVTISV